MMSDLISVYICSRWDRGTPAAYGRDGEYEHAAERDDRRHCWI